MLKLRIAAVIVVAAVLAGTAATAQAKPPKLTYGVAWHTASKYARGNFVDGRLAGCKRQSRTRFRCLAKVPLYGEIELPDGTFGPPVILEMTTIALRVKRFRRAARVVREVVR